MDNSSIIIVSGSTGFIGSSLVRHLVDHATSFGTWDRDHKNPGYFKFVYHSPQEQARIYEKLTWADATNQWKNLTRTGKKLIFINLSSYGVLTIQKDFEPLVQGNLMHTKYFLDAALECQAERFIHMGSCSEYAIDSCSSDQIKESDPTGPRTPYGILKTASTNWVQTILAKNTLKGVVLRCFGVFGYGEHNNRLLPFVCKNILDKKFPIALTPGKQIRDFSYVEDIVSAIILASQHSLPIENHPTSSEAFTYNLCSGVGTSVEDFVKKICSVTGTPLSKIDFGAIPYRSDEAIRIVGNPSKFQQWTGWRPEYTISAGIEKSWKLFVSQHSEK